MEAFDNGFRTGPYRKGSGRTTIAPPGGATDWCSGHCPDSSPVALCCLGIKAAARSVSFSHRKDDSVAQDLDMGGGVRTDSGGGAGEEEDAHAVKNHGAQWKQVTATDSWACLMSNLAREGLQVRANVASDGNCQFAAITDHLERVRGTTVSHQQLRDRVVQYLTDNPTLGANWDEYLLRLSRPGVWGDEFILQAIANMEDVCIQMVSDLAPWKRSITGSGPGRTVKYGPVWNPLSRPGDQDAPPGGATDIVARPLPRPQPRPETRATQLPGTTPGTCWTSRAPRGADVDVVQD
ncbi:Glycosyl transferases group 1 [Branchiostoma belcheri]|nr:Glycosyl transferases group 1 [Branchiostoma belcheri]